MRNDKAFCVIFAADSKSWARDPITAASTAAESTRECRLAPAQITDELNYLAAPQLSADGCGELLGLF